MWVEYECTVGDCSQVSVYLAIERKYDFHNCIDRLFSDHANLVVEIHLNIEF